MISVSGLFRRRWLVPWVGVCTCCAIVLANGCVPVHPQELSVNAADEETIPSIAEVADPALMEDADPAIAALDFVADELLVQPLPGADAEALTAAYAKAGAEVVSTLDELDLVVLRVPPGALVSTAAALNEEVLLDTIQKNYLFDTQAVPNDTLFSRQDYLHTIGMSGAWDVSTGDEDTVIAIVDTGVYGDHEDLSGKIIDGWNIYDDNADFSDVVGHGTQVAGVAAAMTNNGTGVAGIAWDSPILAVRVVDREGQASSRDIAAGILWAVNHDADVINVSFAPLWSNRIVRAAAQTAFRRGKLVVISAGNSGGITRGRGYPEAIFVGAMDAGGSLASFSDKGPFVDIVAPGTSIRSTRIGGAYALADGTSFAAPIITGIVALAWSSNPELRPVSIIETLMDHAVDLGIEGKDATFGNGLVDAAGAVDAASKTAASRDTTAPTLSTNSIKSGDQITRRSLVVVSSTDRNGVADVTLSIDDVVVAVDTRSPYRLVIDPSRYDAGTHEIALVATDVVGNRSDPLTINVRFGEANSRSAASIEFRSPQPGATVSGFVTIQAGISSAVGLALVEWLVDGDSVFSTSVSGKSSSVSYRWPSDAYGSGSHTITLVVTDSDGRLTSGALSLMTR